MDTPRRGSAFASLRHRDFSVLWSAALASNIGTWMQTTTVPYVLDQLTHSTVVVGVGVFFTFFPVVLAAPIGGSLADRHSRRTILLWSQAVMMLAAFGLWGLWGSGEATPVTLLALIVVSALANGITLAPWQAFVPQLVPRDDMLNAVRLNIVQLQVARALGPGLAGLVLATLGPGPAFFANGLSFVIVLVALLVIPARAVGAPAPGVGIWAHFSDGVRYVRERRILAAAMLTFFAVAFFGQSVVQLIEPFARRVLHVGAGQYGLLVGAYGVGAILGALVTIYGEHWRRSRIVLIGIAILVGAEVALGLAPGYGVALGAIVVFGVAWSLGQITLMTSVQANVNETHRGRVMSIYVTAGNLGFPVGGLIGGVTGGLVGLQATFVGAAMILVVCIVYAYASFDRFRLFDQSIEHTEHIRSRSR